MNNHRSSRFQLGTVGDTLRFQRLTSTKLRGRDPQRPRLSRLRNRDRRPLRADLMARLGGPDRKKERQAALPGLPSGVAPPSDTSARCRRVPASLASAPGANACRSTLELSRPYAQYTAATITGGQFNDDRQSARGAVRSPPAPPARLRLGCRRPVDTTALRRMALGRTLWRHRHRRGGRPDEAVDHPGRHEPGPVSERRPWRELGAHGGRHLLDRWPDRWGYSRNSACAKRRSRSGGA